MDIKQYIKPNILLPILTGLLICLLLFFLGDLDDAPGLSAIGLVLGTVLVFIGVHNMNKKIKMNVIVPFFYGILGIIAIFVLSFDGEFENIPQLFFIGISLCVGLIVIGIIKLLKPVKERI